MLYAWQHWCGETCHYITEKGIEKKLIKCCIDKNVCPANDLKGGKKKKNTLNLVD